MISESAGISEEACIYRLLMRHGRAGALRAFTRMKEIESWPDQSLLKAVELLVAKGAQLVEDPLDGDNTLAWAQARVQQTNQPNGSGSRLLELLLQHSSNRNIAEKLPTQVPNVSNAWGDKPADDVLTVMKHVLKYSNDEQRQIVLHHPFNATALLAAAAREGRSKRDVVHWALAVGACVDGIDLRTIRSRRAKRQDSTSSTSKQPSLASETPPNTQASLDSNNVQTRQKASCVAQTIPTALDQSHCNGHERTAESDAQAVGHGQAQLEVVNVQQQPNGLHPDAGPQSSNCQCDGRCIDEVEHHCQPDDDIRNADASLATEADINCKLHTCNGCATQQQQGKQCGTGPPVKQTQTGLHDELCNGDACLVHTNGFLSGPTTSVNGHQDSAAYLHDPCGISNSLTAFGNGITGMQGHVSELTASSVFAKQFSCKGLTHADSNGSDPAAQAIENNGMSAEGDELSWVDYVQPTPVVSKHQSVSNEINTLQPKECEACAQAQSTTVRLTEEELKLETEKWVISPLAEAAAAGDSYVVELLIMVHEADPGAHGGLAERMAVKHGHHQLAKYIYEQVLERQAAKRGLKSKLAEAPNANISTHQRSAGIQSSGYQYVTLGDWVKSVMPTWSGVKRALMGPSRPQSRIKHNNRVTHGKQAPVVYHSSTLPPNTSHKGSSKRMLFYGLAALATTGAAGYLMYRLNSNSRTANSSNNNSNVSDASINK